MSTVQRTFLYIQTEFCNQTSLDKFLISATESEKLSEFPRIIYQTAKGLSAIHAQGIIHRDLKPDNIYATKKAGRDLNIWKIGDFGLSIKFGPSPPNLFDALEFQIDSEGSSLESFKGADTFRSPEMYNQHPYSSKTDIYSLALIFICVLFKFPSVKKRRAYFIDLQLGHCTPESVHLQETMDNNPETKIKYCSLIEKMLSHKPGKELFQVNMHTEVERAKKDHFQIIFRIRGNFFSNYFCSQSDNPYCCLPLCILISNQGMMHRHLCT